MTDSLPPRLVALYGGSFDPPHVGHVLVVAWILSTHRADEVWVIPSGAHPFGKVLAPFADRVAMARAAFEWLGSRVRIDDIEGVLPGPSYTVRTVEALASAHSNTRFACVVGTDVEREIDSWRDAARLRTMVDWIVVQRAGVVAAAGSKGDSPAFPEISSTEVRAKLAQGIDVSAWVPAAVLAYIAGGKLYSGGTP